MKLSSRSLIKKLYASYDAISRRKKRQLLVVLDAMFFCLAIYIAFWLRFEETFPLSEISNYAWLIILLVVVKLASFQLCGVYRPILRYANLEFLPTALRAICYSSGTLVILAYWNGSWPLPRSVLIIDAFLTLFFLVGLRLLIRTSTHNLASYAHKNTPPERLLIYGAGAAGSQLARALANDRTYRVIGFVDDNQDLQQSVVLQGFKVYSPEQLALFWEQENFDTVILAMPSVAKDQKRAILEHLQSLSIPVKTVPSLNEIISGKVSIQKLRKIDIADLLGREEVAPDLELLQMQVTGKIVLVTGAGGSIGSELCRQIAQQKPKCLVLYELNEFALYKIDIELAETYPQLQRFAYLGNVTDPEYLTTILKQHQVETIYHAAAYKHVPLVEINPARGIENNVLGTLNAARCAIRCNVKNFVLISTDKAVRPTNVMGASKRVAELVIQALAAQQKNNTRFAIVRFGNVLDSSGSVVPRFRKQIAQGKTITVTHREITRYFMTIPEAARLVMQAGAMAKGGEVFLLEMGEPVRIYDLALQMVRLSGLIPGRDIEIKVTGLRPGEKLYEELLIAGDNVQPTQHPKIFCAQEYHWSWQTLQPQLDVLLENVKLNHRAGIVNQLHYLVPEYKPEKSQVNLTPPAVPRFLAASNSVEAWRMATES